MSVDCVRMYVCTLHHAPREAPPMPTTKASAAGKRDASCTRQTRRIRNGQWLPRLLRARAIPDGIELWMEVQLP